MLVHSPPLPIAIDYKEFHDITAEDEVGTTLAFKQRDCVRRVRLDRPVTSLQKLVAVIDGEYPTLEHLVVWNWMEDNSTTLTFPEILQALHLHHLVLSSFALPRRSRLLTTAMGLVTLCLLMATYSHSNTISPLAFVHAPAGSSRDQLLIPCSQPSCKEATRAYADHDIRSAF